MRIYIFLENLGYQIDGKLKLESSELFCFQIERKLEKIM